MSHSSVLMHHVLLLQGEHSSQGLV